jgi:transposase
MTRWPNPLRGLLKLFGRRLGKAKTPAKRAERLAALFARQPALRPVQAPRVTAQTALE